METSVKYIFFDVFVRTHMFFFKCFFVSCTRFSINFFALSQGVAVVDTHGRMVANFSASDLVGLNENNFHLLTLPVMEFLTRMHGFPKVSIEREFRSKR